MFENEQSSILKVMLQNLCMFSLITSFLLDDEVKQKKKKVDIKEKIIPPIWWFSKVYYTFVPVSVSFLSPSPNANSVPSILPRTWMFRKEQTDKIPACILLLQETDNEIEK